MAIYSSLMISLFLITLLASSSSATPIPASGGGKRRSGGLTHICNTPVLIVLANNVFNR